MDGSIFLKNWYLDGWLSKFPRGTSLPKPNLRTPRVLTVSIIARQEEPFVSFGLYDVICHAVYNYSSVLDLCVILAKQFYRFFPEWDYLFYTIA